MLAQYRRDAEPIAQFASTHAAHLSGELQVGRY